MGTVSVKLSGSLDAKLAAVADERRLSKSALIRMALQQELGRKRRTRSGSFGALAKDLAGCMAGPADLSHNPKHFRGYGR